MKRIRRFDLLTTDLGHALVVCDLTQILPPVSGYHKMSEDPIGTCAGPAECLPHWSYLWPGPVSVSAMNLLKIQLRDGVIAVQQLSHSFNAFFFLFCAGQLFRRIIAHEVVSKQGVVNHYVHLAIKITRWLLLILELIY